MNCQIGGEKFKKAYLLKMLSDLFTYLKTFSTDPFEVDRLLISAYLYSNNIQEKANNFIGKYRICEDENSFQNLQDFMSIHELNSLEELIELFEFVISPAEKIVSGAVYTPKTIREYILKECLDSSKVSESSLTICDPACGCSGFLFSAAKIIKNKTKKSYKDIFATNLFGLDIQGYAITRSKLLLSLLAITEGEINTEFEFNLYSGNSLGFNWSDTFDNFEGFDVIVGNPPYVCSRNIDEDSKKLIFDWKVSSTGHPDLYIPFFQIGYESLKSGGKLGFITMNTFFRSVNGRALRQYFEDQSISLKILDFGSNQIFHSKSTYTCICLIHKVPSKTIQYAKGNEASLTDLIDFKEIQYKKLNHNNGWGLQNHDIVREIENTGHQFGELYKTRNGIATLKNHIYIFKEIEEDDDFYYLQNGEVYPIEKKSCKEIVNPNKLTKPIELESLKQKAIFPYIFNEQGEANLIGEETFKDLYPMTYKYLSSKKDVLSTRDKGNGQYPEWFAYGRNQSLERFPNKLFFPHITSGIPSYSISHDQDLLFYNGLAVVSENELELMFLKKFMSSKLFWFYIQNSSKPYGNGYYSMSRNYIKNIGVANFSDVEKERIINEDQNTVDQIIENKYGISIP